LTNHILESILKSGVAYDPEGKAHKVHSQIDPAEGEFLQRLIRESNAQRSIEIGCAYGISSLYICDALAERDASKHLILDPYESTYWHGVGAANLSKAGYDFAELIERSSEYVLPELIAAGEIFDFAFIDGSHDFQYVMTDMLLINRLLRPGGLVVLDDWSMSGVYDAVKLAIKHLRFEIVDYVNRPGPARVLVNRIRRRLPSIMVRMFPSPTSSMVALRRVEYKPAPAEIQQILLVDEWDQRRGISTAETCQKFGITTESLSRWRSQRKPSEKA